MSPWRPGFSGGALRRHRLGPAAVALALSALAGCDGTPWLGLTRDERAAARRFDHDRAVAVCERNLFEVAGPQGLTPGLSTPSRNPYGEFVMAVSFWRTSGLMRIEHHCLINPVTYAVTEWRTPMNGADRVL